MNLMQEIIANAQANRQRIVLPEGDEPRTLKAADQLLADNVADIILIGPAEKIKEMTAEFGLKNIGKARIIDPMNNLERQKYADLLFEIRKAKGMTPEQAYDLAGNFMYLGILLVKAGEARRSRQRSPQHHRRHASSCPANHQDRAWRELRQRCLHDVPARRLSLRHRWPHGVRRLRRNTHADS